MYIKEDLVYDKHSGQLIGFSSLGNVNDHLLTFEHSVVEDQAEEIGLEKAMMVVIIRSLFTSFRFPYAQFPRASVTGDLLFHPFWQAIYRLERMELKLRRCKYNF